MSDISINIHADDRLLICKRIQPVAELRLLPLALKDGRRMGLAKGEFTVPEAFFEPLPDELLDAFEDHG